MRSIEYPPVGPITLEWGVLSNVEEEGRFRSELIIRNQGSVALPSDGWGLYFTFWRPIIVDGGLDGLVIDHINGDFYRIRPGEGFKPIGPGSSRTIPLSAGAWAINESDAPDGFYFVWGDPEDGTIQELQNPTIRPFVEMGQLSRSESDRLPVDTAERRYEANENARALNEEEIPPILPRPASLTRGTGTVTLNPTWRILYDGPLEGEARYLGRSLVPILGRWPEIAAGSDSTRNSIRLRIDPAMDTAESYRLSVRPEQGITITGADAAGVFYGVQSLRLLIPPQAYSGKAGEPDGAGRDNGVDVERGRLAIPVVDIDDRPRFGYRGMHLDVARNFQPVEEVKKLLDLMATYKLNKFHFHLSDDEGWRIAIADLPELTEVGGRRGHTLNESEHLMPSLGSGPTTRSRGSGFFTRDQFIDVLRFANARHIEVIPEIDMPGHARSAIVAMEARRNRLRRNGRPEEAGRHALVDPADESEYRSVQMWTDNVVDVCMESTYRFLETVVDDLIAMYDEAGVPLNVVHTGGDEVPDGVWQKSPSCEQLIASTEELNDVDDLPDYFLRRFDAILDRHGLATGGWEEIALTMEHGDGRTVKTPNPDFVDHGFRPYVWNAVWGWGAEDTAYKLANAGYPIVISNASNFYFDLAYAKHPEEPGLYWAGFIDTLDPFAFIPFDLYKVPQHDMLGRTISDDAYEEAERLTEPGRRNVLGLQGQLWSENVRSNDRLEYMVFPRLISLAERAWAPQPAWATIDHDESRHSALQEDWNVFANALGRRELPRLDYLHTGVHYRIPPPGAVIRDGQLYANNALPGFTVRYSTDGSEPSAASTAFEGPVDVHGGVMLRTFSASGRGSRTVSIAP